jgi:hypothetical protein
MLVSGRIENFKDYSQFDSLKSFNNTIEMFLADHKKDFTKGELVAFKRLVRFSAKYVGVANAKIGTLVKAINEKLNGFGVSRSTFERMLRKAKDLGILSIENTAKSKGGKGHNVYIFNTIDVLKKRKLTYCESNETLTDSKGEQGDFKREANNLSKTSNNKRLNKRIGHVPVLDHTFVSDYVPKAFTHLVKCFFDNAKTIEEYWRMVKIDTYYVRTLIDEDTILHTALESFRQMIGKLKKGIVNKPIAYFKRIINKKINQAIEELPI